MNPTASTAAALDESDIADFRAGVRRFVEREVSPFVAAWDEAGTFPRELYRKAAAAGLLGLGFPEALGGTPAPMRLRLAVPEEIARAGSGGLMASLFSHTIGLPPIAAHGSEALRRAVVPPVLAGEKIAALAVTEPSGGSDVARLACRARRDGAEWVIDGEKTFITSGLRADWITVAVRSGGPGAGGISLLAVAGDSAGLERTKLDKMGWWCSDTAHLRFSSCRVPAGHLIGDENAGFRLVMENFNAERLTMAAGAAAFAAVCYDEALDWARQRKTFGLALVEHQAIRHKLMDMRMRIASTRAWIERLARGHDLGPVDAEWVAELCLLKNHATQAMQFCADAAVQILGGGGYVRGTKSERIYREVKVMMIGGGAEEIMKELAARQRRMTTGAGGQPVVFEPEFVERLRALFEETIPFNRVIGLVVESIAADRCTASIAMRPELIGSASHQRLHGGVISAALDAMAGLAVMAAIGARHLDEPPAARMQRFGRIGTIDLRIDYLRPATGDRFLLEGEVLRLGSRVATTRMSFADAAGRLLATGSAAYIVS